MTGEGLRGAPEPPRGGLVARLNRWADGLGRHVADERGHCVVCMLRWPCDWALVLTDVRLAALRIEYQVDALAALRRALGDAYVERVPKSMLAPRRRRWWRRNR